MIKSIDPKKRPQPLWHIRERTSQTCKHSQILVDVESREISCEACEKVLDPFNVILEMAYKERRETGDVRGMREWVAELRAEEKRLRRRIQNLNYKIKELEKPADEGE